MQNNQIKAKGKVTVWRNAIKCNKSRMKMQELAIDMQMKVEVRN